RRGDVDGDVARVVVHLLQADQVVLGRLLDRRRRVLADVDAENAALLGEFRGPDVFQQFVDAGVVETRAVDDALRFRNAEQARLRVAVLGARRDRADFEETEAEPGQAVDVVAVLVQAGGEADRIGELEAHDLDRAGGDRLGQAAGKAGGIQERDAAHADTVGGFGVEREEEFADQWIEHSPRFYRIAARLAAWNRDFETARRTNAAAGNPISVRRWNSGHGRSARGAGGSVSSIDRAGPDGALCRFPSGQRRLPGCRVRRFCGES